MAHGKKDKRYGLIIPKNLKVGPRSQIGKAASIFDDNSSDDDEKKKKTAINQELNAVAEKMKQTRQTKGEIERALKEDPTVYEYDEIYDKMEEQKSDVVKTTKDQNRKPKYIENLLKSAAMRKREQERRVERGVQREREKEGDEFADKESFVTSAYRQKMIEQAEEEERLRKQDDLDSRNDVTKQKDLTRFYRNLLNRNVALGAPSDQPEKARTSVDEGKGREKNEMSGEQRVKQEVLSTDEEEINLRKNDRHSNIKLREKNESWAALRPSNDTTENDKSLSKSESKETIFIKKKSKEIQNDNSGSSSEHGEFGVANHIVERAKHKHEFSDERGKGEENEKMKKQRDRKRESEKKRKNKDNEDSDSHNSRKEKHRTTKASTKEDDYVKGVWKSRKDDLNQEKEHKNRRFRKRVSSEEPESPDRSRRPKSSQDKKSRHYGTEESRHDTEMGESRKKRKYDTIYDDLPESFVAENSRGRESKRSRDRESKTFENEGEKTVHPGYKNSTKTKLCLSKEEPGVFAKRNDASSVLAARERYLNRKGARIMPEIHPGSDSD